jgi:hypothetical protein|tara:strand:+ start:230 stop:481 length:252 start_codon:yes stop_codon:yes gene_type:complete
MTIETINMNTASFGQDKYEDITLAEYKAKWSHTLHSIQILCGGMGEPFSTNLERYNQVKELVDAMMETEFNRIYEVQTRSTPL